MSNRRNTHQPTPPEEIRQELRAYGGGRDPARLAQYLLFDAKAMDGLSRTFTIRTHTALCRNDIRMLATTLRDYGVTADVNEQFAVELLSAMHNAAIARGSYSCRFGR